MNLRLPGPGPGSLSSAASRHSSGAKFSPASHRRYGSNNAMDVVRSDFVYRGWKAGRFGREPLFQKHAHGPHTCMAEANFYWALARVPLIKSLSGRPCVPRRASHRLGTVLSDLDRQIACASRAPSVSDHYKACYNAGARVLSMLRVPGNFPNFAAVLLAGREGNSRLPTNP